MTVEKFVTALGITVSVYCINHGSLALAIQWPESGRTCTIWVDPVANYYGNTIDYSDVPAADVLLITHAHGDHLDKALAEEAIRGGALCLGSAEVAAALREASALPHHAPVKVAASSAVLVGSMSEVDEVSVLGRSSSVRASDLRQEGSNMMAARTAMAASGFKVFIQSFLFTGDNCTFRAKFLRIFVIYGDGQDTKFLYNRSYRPR